MKVTLEVEVSEEALEMAKRRANADFNPDGNNKVDVMKQMSALFMAYCEDNRIDENGESRNPSAQRNISTALTHMETAAMFAVKSNFSK